MDVLSIASKIEEKIGLLERGRGLLDDCAKKKANTIGEYRKKLEITTLTLKEQGMPATLIKDLAKGESYKEEVAMDLAESMYKIALTKLRVIETELNGYQSINRHLSQM